MGYLLRARPSPLGFSLSPPPRPFCVPPPLLAAVLPRLRPHSPSSLPFVSRSPIFPFLPLPFFVFLLFPPLGFPLLNSSLPLPLPPPSSSALRDPWPRSPQSPSSDLVRRLLPASPLPESVSVGALGPACSHLLFLQIPVLPGLHARSLLFSPSGVLLGLGPQEASSPRPSGYGVQPPRTGLRCRRGTLRQPSRDPALLLSPSLLASSRGPEPSSPGTSSPLGSAASPAPTTFNQPVLFHYCPPFFRKPKIDPETKYNSNP